MLLQPITVPFSKSTLKPSVYTLSQEAIRLTVGDGSPSTGCHTRLNT